jgi:hypothetical protein
MRSRLSTGANLLEKEMLCQETPWRRDEEGDCGIQIRLPTGTMQQISEEARRLAL